MAVPNFQPILASAGPPPASVVGWVVEPKVDGWRLLAQRCFLSLLRAETEIERATGAV